VSASAKPTGLVGPEGLEPSGLHPAGDIPRAAQRVEAFKLANRHSPIVMSEWLDANKRSPKGPPETWVCRRIELADGTSFTFTREEAEQLGSWDDHWWYGIETAASKARGEHD
jgi:hypothetical protein